ncbi:MAG: hypothetical protein B7X76_01750 [Azorhizobium sp. 39-67-5]|nr:MAG: hypothetical protein B7Z30_11380 [Rhizobiales bacterium 12-68-15]OYX84614.1 MAG: hypothetical protein B7Y84_16665 [Azorhizobium sp. 32-67-21]OYY13221.1 MAG: hypothetical protein B7Y70_02885 [Rhizobiales bacterium 35-68-8]OZA91726.1 MAG: hypothetical protein B7X76_01750 [Azorhizobium sp. 39-67-5]
MTTFTTDAAARSNALSEAALDAVSGGLEQGGAWRATKNGHFVYDGWVKDGSMTMTYSGSNRREEVGKGEIRLFGRNASGEFLKATLRT